MFTSDQLRRNLMYMLGKAGTGLPCWDFYIANLDGTTTLWDCETGEVSTIQIRDAMQQKRRDYVHV